MSLLLVITIFLPLLGASLMWPLAALGRRYVRWAALVVTVATLALALFVIAGSPTDLRKMDANRDGLVTKGDDQLPQELHSQFDRLDVNGDGKLDHGELKRVDEYAVTDVEWLNVSGANIRFSIGLDGLGIWMFGLSALLMVTAVLVSWESIKERAALFYAMLLLLEFGCLGVFVARDIILFYVFFEFTLIPLFFIIGIWGSEKRRHAAVKFFLFTLAGSLLTFLGLLAIVLINGQTNHLTFSIPELTDSLANGDVDRQGAIPTTIQLWIFVALFAGFAIKVPLFPLHTWLPLAHTEAPTAGSVFLAGILLKIGTYGFLRFSIPMLPDAAAIAMPWLLWLAVIGIMYGALVALAQSDIKRLIAYSSVSHMGFCMLGLFALNHLGLQGGALQMVNHGISTGALFAIVGMIYDRYHTRQISDLGGLARRLPVLTFFMVFFTLSSIGLPGMNGFSGEFPLLLGMFQRAFSPDIAIENAWHLRVIAVLALSGVVLGAWYMLWLIQRVFFGPLREPKTEDDEPVRDLSRREVAALVPLAVLVLWIGLWPKFFLDRMDPALDRVADVVQDPVNRRLGLPNRTSAVVKED